MLNCLSAAALSSHQSLHCNIKTYSIFKVFLDKLNIIGLACVLNSNEILITPADVGRFSICSPVGKIDIIVIIGYQLGKMTDDYNI